MEKQQEIIVDCDNCGFEHRCCETLEVVLTRDEARKDIFKDNKVISPLREKGKILGFVNVLKSKLDGSCMFLRFGKCTIYDDRPEACRVYSCINDNRIKI